MLSFITDFLISIDPMLSIMLISAFASFLSTIVMKYTSNQNRLKELKKQQKEQRKKVKDLQKQGKQSEMLKEQQEMMKATQESFKHTMKPMLYTMLPLLLIFGWLNAHSVFMEISPEEEFSVLAFFDESNNSVTLNAPDNFRFVNERTQKIENTELTDKAEKIVSKNRKLKKEDTYNVAIWRLESQESGRFMLELDFKDQTYNKEILISEERRYVDPARVFDEDTTRGLKAIAIGNRPIEFNFLGITFGWLGLYIICSIIFGNVFRKLLRVA